MRQAFFAVMLVAASFAGGAVVNGPGLRWAQDMLFNRIGLDDGGGDDSDAGGPSEGEESTIPAAPIPPLAVEPTETETEPDQVPPAGPLPVPLARTPATSMAAAGTPGRSNPLPAAAGAPVPDPRDLSSLKTTELPPLERPGPLADPLADDPPAAGPRGLADGSVALASLATGADDEPDAGPAPGGPNDPADWPGVRRSLSALGVARYGVEGETGGRVRFHCVIPLAGRRAVGQYFEAEGDDEFQAARAAIRRVALWRATEGADESP